MVFWAQINVYQTLQMLRLSKIVIVQIHRQRGKITRAAALLLLMQWCVSAPGYARQNSYADSLIRELPSVESDSLKIHFLNELAWEFRAIDRERAVEYAFRAVELSQKTGDKKQWATALNRLGEAYRRNGIFDKSRDYFKKALDIERAEEHTFGIARASSMLAVVERALGNYDVALEYGLESLENFEKIENVAAAARARERMAAIYREQGKYELALQYMSASLETRRQLGNEAQIALGLTNMGNIYFELDDFEKALELYVQGRLIWQRLNNRVQVANLLMNIGLVYTEQGDYTRAERNYLRSLAIQDSLDYDQFKNLTYVNMGYLYSLKGEVAKAEGYFKKSINLNIRLGDQERMMYAMANLGELFAKRGNSRASLEPLRTAAQLAREADNRVVLLEVYRDLSDVFYAIDAFDSSRWYNRAYLAIRDSIDTAYRNAVIIQRRAQEDQARNDVLEKEKEIQAGQIARQQLFIVFLSIGIVLALLAVVGFVRWFWQRKKTAQAILEKELAESRITENLKDQELKAVGAMLKGQEKERHRIAKDLHDNLGSMLAVVKIHVSTVEESLASLDAGNEKRYNEASKLLDDACEEVRRISHNMQSGTLVKFGLIPALLDLKNALEGSGKWEVSLLDFGFDDERLDNDVELSLYRIIQELMNNIIKHAEAKHITVQLIKKDDGLNITVEDDGKGFNRDAGDFIPGLGLKNVEARVAGLEGEIDIDSGKGGGTTVTINVPLN